MNLRDIIVITIFSIFAIINIVVMIEDMKKDIKYEREVERWQTETVK